MDNSLFNDTINAKKITRLCHLTRSQKAVHILSSEAGIKAVDFLETDIYDANDSLRLDGRTDCINCSIQYPNHWYWNKVKNKDPLFKDWVILLINPAILLLDTTEFCAVNAATGRGVHIKKGFSAFQELFDNTVQGRNRALNMLSCCPTDDQAEVLVYKNISRKDIIGVIVKDKDQAERESIRWYDCLSNIPKLDIIIAPDCFTGQWSNKVRRGIAPLEYKYDGGE
jgi:hypothetical protein